MSKESKSLLSLLSDDLAHSVANQVWKESFKNIKNFILFTEHYIYLLFQIENLIFFMTSPQNCALCVPPTSLSVTHYYHLARRHIVLSFTWGKVSYIPHFIDYSLDGYGSMAADRFNNSDQPKRRLLGYLT